MKSLSGSDALMSYGKFEVDFFSTSVLLYPNVKGRLRLIRARPTFYTISDNSNFSLGNVNRSLYTYCIVFEDVYHKERGYACIHSGGVQFLERTSKKVFIRARQNQFNQEKFFHIAPVCRIDIATDTNSASTRTYTENPFWYRQFNVRQFRIPGWGQ